MPFKKAPFPANVSTVGQNREGAGARVSDIPGYKGHAVKVIPSRVQRIARVGLQDTASHTKTRTVSNNEIKH